MDTFERNAARNLAVSYNAYLEASLGNQPIERIRMWAKMLLRCQRETGIELIDADRLLYPTQGPSQATVARLRDGVEGDGAELAAELAGAAQQRCEKLGMRFDDDGGGALVPSPKPQPRKPSPGASVTRSEIAARAAEFYANRP